MGLLVRLIPRPVGEPVVRMKERHDSNVIFLFFPGTPDYPQARKTADEFLANCLAQAVEAPRSGA